MYLLELKRCESERSQMKSCRKRIYVFSNGKSNICQLQIHRLPKTDDTDLDGHLKTMRA
jgi:hypothetical protein